MIKKFKGADKILNLKEIEILDPDSQSSSSCSGRVNFNIDCETEKGYCEDPDFTGTMKVLDVKKDSKESDVYTLKVKFGLSYYALCQDNDKVITTAKCSECDGEKMEWDY